MTIVNIHQAKTNLIIDFYGGFFAESCVFICMEYVPPITPTRNSRWTVEV